MPYGDILAESIEIDENRGDYRLAYLGFPMLAELLDDKDRRSYKWLVQSEKMDFIF